MATTFGASTSVELPIVGGGSVRAGRVWCVGRNFADHAREMGADPSREPPFFFAKPTDALTVRPRAIAMPPQTADFQHEVELAIVLSRGGRDLDLAAAEASIGWCAVAIDLTRRDLQADAKKAGRPWALAKGFDQSAPIAALRPWPGSDVAGRATIELRVDGSVRQRSTLDCAIWSPAEVVQHLSASVAVQPGDVILCGTPAGVARLEVGQRVEAEIAGLPPLSFDIAPEGASRAAATSEEVLAAWFGPADAMRRWFVKDEAWDGELRLHFADAMRDAATGVLDDWAATPRGRLALILLLDQLPRNLGRGTAAAFASDAKALDQAKAAVARGDDRGLSDAERCFVYLPFEHAESLVEVETAVALFTRLAGEASAAAAGFAATLLDYAQRHAAVVRAYGRYPHRNAALGRASTPEEVAYLATPGAGF